MRHFLYVTIFSFGIGTSFSLLAADASSTVSETKTQNPSSTSTTSTTSKPTEEQSQMAAWMLESAQVAKDYVEGLDKGQYPESWTKGDQLFQHTISKDEWAIALNNSRKRLGKVKSRSLKDQRPAKDPHGLPRGAYMVVEYDTSFENAPASGELLTLRRGSDGKWRVLTYQVN